MPKKRSFFERLAGTTHFDEDELENELDEFENEKLSSKKILHPKELPTKQNIIEEAEDEEGQLAVDVYQTPTELIVQTMVSGVRPEDVEISITRDTLTIRGKREESRSIDDENYFVRELYWGSFSRTISLPAEVEPEDAEAVEKHGMLILKLPKINRSKQTNVKVKSL